MILKKVRWPDRIGKSQFGGEHWFDVDTYISNVIVPACVNHKNHGLNEVIAKRHFTPEYDGIHAYDVDDWIWYGAMSSVSTIRATVESLGCGVSNDETLQTSKVENESLYPQ